MQRAEQIGRLQALRDKLDGQIAELGKVMAREDEAWQRVHRAEVESLQRRRAHAGRMLAELELADAESWQEEGFVTALLSVFDHIGQRLERILGKAPSRSP